MEERLLENKICVVTGASKGIGKAIATMLAKKGAVVYAVARDIASLEDWSIELSNNYNTRVILLCLDVTDYDTVKKQIIEIKSKEGRIDVLVNNAGMVTYEMIPMIDMNRFKQMWEVNVTSVLFLTQLVSRIMSRQKKGSIINISSLVGEKGASGQTAYATTKGAVIALTKSAAKELAPLGIRVNAIAPGMVATDRFLNEMESRFKNKTDQIGMGRLAEPDEIANLSVFLASDASAYITGQIIGIDGSIVF
ncbi:SDR family oxidoreductase [Flavobacterium chungnamense]|uniref:SDR family NAD(P)-dependent oxidoreductase n=1 Tax=Flavobacterium chungnamense TaxID=706182 RepID=A0ABP7UXN1_9FLAO